MTPIEGDGTPESVWRAWGRTFPPFSLEGCPGLVVVAPHPDDEVLGAGGLLALAASAGFDVTVVAVTDGGASHPGSPTLRADQLRALRPRESVAALAELGLHTEPVRLGVPDGHVAEHEDAITDALVAVVDEVTDGSPGTPWVVSTWRGDGHPDHEATGRAAARAAAAVGSRLVEHPVWTWHWSHPDDPRVPWDRAVRLVLPPAVQAAKVAAVARFVTQVLPLSEDPADAPVLGPHVLARLLRPTEVYFT